MPNVGHDVESTHVAPELVVDCRRRQQRPWPMLPMVVCFCVCVSQSRSYKNCGYSLTVVQKLYKPQNLYQRKGRKYDAVYNHAVVELP
jgi:hypothetical protein